MTAAYLLAIGIVVGVVAAAGLTAYGIVRLVHLVEDRRDARVEAARLDAITRQTHAVTAAVFADVDRDSIAEFGYTDAEIVEAFAADLAAWDRELRGSRASCACRPLPAPPHDQAGAEMSPLNIGELFLAGEPAEMPVTVAGSVRRAQLFPCPTCGQLRRGLLAPCIYPACQAADARATAAEERRYES